MSDTRPAGRRKLAAILHLDVVGFSAMMSRDDEATTDRIVALHRSVRDLVEAHGGTVAGTAGDAVLAWFESIVAAVECAVRIQEQLAGATSEASEPIRARIGIHLGDVITEGDTIFGDGVNIAARLEGMADPGAILVSDAVYQQVRTRVEVPFEDLGTRRLKNLPDPVHVHRVPAGWFRGTETAGTEPGSQGAGAVVIDEAIRAFGDVVREAADLAKHRIAESRERSPSPPQRPKPAVGPKRDLGRQIEESVAARRKRAPRRRSHRDAVALSAGHLILLVLGSVLVWAYVTGSIDGGWAFLLGCLCLGLAIGGIGESASGITGTRAVLVGIGFAVGAVGFDHLAVRTVLWIAAAGLVARGVRRPGDGR